MDAMVLSGRMLFAAALGCVGLVLIAFSAGVLVAERRPHGDGATGPGPRLPRRRRGRAPWAARGAADAISEATREMRAAAEEVLRDLERRSAAASRILEEAEAKIARLKDMLAENEAGGDAREEPRAHVEDPRARERRALVFSLADQGLSTAEIARRAGIGRGEAQLILDLRAKGGEAGQG